MKKLLVIILLLFFSISAEAEVLQAGIEIEHIPKSFFGSWRVSAKLNKTDAHSIFKPQSLDFWNLSRINNVVELENPMTGANAEIFVQTVEGNIIVFSKRLPYDGNKILTDTVSIRLNGNEFSGINSLVLETYSLIDKHLIKTQTATYHIKGEKIAGESIVETDKAPKNTFPNSTSAR